MLLNNCCENYKEGKYPVFEGNKRLMFITHRTQRYTECEEIKMVLEGGASWVQLRMKENMSLDTAYRAFQICSGYSPETVLCIDDAISIALACGAQSVHLGKNDMPVQDAWKMVAESDRKNDIFYIGATANTWEDIQHAVQQNASYIGLGPYRFTETKKKLSPVLGLEGYRILIRQCKEANIQIPIFAIGGICLEDVAPLMETGITGIAVSGAIIQASDPVEETRRFINAINKY